MLVKSAQMFFESILANFQNFSYLLPEFLFLYSSTAQVRRGTTLEDYISPRTSFAIISTFRDRLDGSWDPWYPRE